MYEPVQKPSPQGHSRCEKEAPRRNVAMTNDRHTRAWGGGSDGGAHSVGGRNPAAWGGFIYPLPISDSVR
jgi:hypothetical protein